MAEFIQELTSGKRMTTTELFSEAAFCAYLGGSEMGKDSLQLLSAARICTELYKRFNEKDAIIDALRLEATRKIVLYCHSNPNAPPDQQAVEIKKHIDEFAAQVAMVQSQ